MTKKIRQGEFGNFREKNGKRQKCRVCAAHRGQKSVYAACAAALAGGVLAISFGKERKRSEKVLRDFLPLIIALRRTQEASGTGLLGITAPRGAVPRL
ncbi:MAG: hypothetical protein IJL30_03005 [Clostridia bacterium]|nr:hypothetical protein [Clostridia bacterium]